jgi:Ser/Thr protein kinase RdoA (MazF antagonist)
MLLEQLRDASFEVPMPVNSADGTNYVELNELVLTLSEFCHGTRFDGSEAQVRAAGGALGELQSPGGELDSCEADDPDVPATRYLAALREEGDNWTAAGFLSESGYQDAIQACSQAVKLLSRSSQSTSPIYIHGDYIGQNILFDDSDEVAAVLDWENVRCDSAYAEVANAANVFAVSLSEGPSEAIDPVQLRPFLTAYRRTCRIDVDSELLFGFMLREAASSVVWGFQNYAEMERQLHRDVGQWWTDNLRSLFDQRRDMLDVISEAVNEP